jgi:anti-sigma factor RsiW
MSGRNCIEGILLSAYLDGELGDEDAARAEMHLATCSKCSTFYEGMKSDRNLLVGALPDEAPPANIKVQLFQRIDAEPEANQPSGIPAWTWPGWILSLRSRSWALACASIVLLAVILSAFHLQNHIEYGRMLAEIDHSRTEWVALGKAGNPFNIDINGVPLRPSTKNPFAAYLNGH